MDLAAEVEKALRALEDSAADFKPVAVKPFVPVFKNRRLAVGDVVRFQGKRCVVDLVNDCRARIRSISIVNVEIMGRQFKAKSNEIWSISPFSEIQVIA